MTQERELLGDVVRAVRSTYWPILAVAAAYVLFAFTSRLLQEHSAHRRAFLEGGPSFLLYAWALRTSVATPTVFGWHATLNPFNVSFLAVVATIALAVVVLVFVIGNLLFRSTPFRPQVGIGQVVAVGAVYADLAFLTMMTTRVP